MKEIVINHLDWASYIKIVGYAHSAQIAHCEWRGESFYIRFPFPDFGAQWAAWFDSWYRPKRVDYFKN